MYLTECERRLTVTSVPTKTAASLVCTRRNARERKPLQLRMLNRNEPSSSPRNPWTLRPITGATILMPPRLKLSRVLLSARDRTMTHPWRTSQPTTLTVQRILRVLFHPLRRTRWKGRHPMNVRFPVPGIPCPTQPLSNPPPSAPAMNPTPCLPPTNASTGL